MTFLPGGRQALVTEKAGRLKLLDARAARIDRRRRRAGGRLWRPGRARRRRPPPRFRQQRPRLSELRRGRRGRHARRRGRPRPAGHRRRRARGSTDFQVIWRQVPKFSGRGHYGHRIAFSPDGRHLFISSGERQEFTPAQDMAVQRRQGAAAQSRRHASRPTIRSPRQGGVAAQIWSARPPQPARPRLRRPTAGSGRSRWARGAATS